VGLARYLCLPLCEAGSLCRGCVEAALDPNGDHALVWPKGRGGRMGGPARRRPGLREGADTDVEVPYYLFTHRYRPSDTRVRIRPGGQDMHFEDSGSLGRHGLQGRGLRRDHRSKANLQQRPIRREVRNGHREQDRGGTSIWRPSRTCNRSPTAAPSSWCGLRIVRVDGPHTQQSTVQKLVNVVATW
jgi:hypothetical protein